VERLVRPLVLPCELLTAGFLGRHEDRHLRGRERQETEILQEPAPRRQGIRRRVRHGLIMGTATIRVTEEEDEEQGIDQQDVFYRVVVFLAALTRGLLSSVLEADDPPFCPVMGKRGDRRGGWDGGPGWRLSLHCRYHRSCLGLRDTEPLCQSPEGAGRSIPKGVERCQQRGQEDVNTDRLYSGP